MLNDAPFWLVLIAAGALAVILTQRWRATALDIRPKDTLDEAYDLGCAELARVRSYKLGDTPDFDNSVHLALAVLGSRKTAQPVSLAELDPDERRRLEELHWLRGLDDAGFDAVLSTAEEARRPLLLATRQLFSRSRISRAEVLVALGIAEARAR